MKMILASCSSPIHIRSIILETSLGFAQQGRGSCILTQDKWLPIDAILAGPNFVDLCRVEVTVDSNFKKKWTLPDLKDRFTALLPTISCHPGISLIISHPSNEYK
jgi:hypothetical protein